MTLRPSHSGFEPRTRDPERRDFFDLRRRIAEINLAAFDFKGTIATPGPPTSGQAPGPVDGDLWIDSNGIGWVWNGTSWVNVGTIRGPQGPTGPQGPPGPSGAASASYVHNQGTVAAVWTIDHNLGFNPSLTVIDSTGTVVEGDLAYPTVNRVVVTFSGGFTGTAYLS